MRKQQKHFTQFFRKGLLRVYCVLGILLGATGPLLSRLNRNAFPIGAYIQVACGEGQVGSPQKARYFILGENKVGSDDT